MEVEEGVDRFNEGVGRGLFEGEVLEEDVVLLVSLELGDVRLGVWGDDDEVGMLVFDGVGEVV